jgi:hypothetical protein
VKLKPPPEDAPVVNDLIGPRDAKK